MPVLGARHHFGRQRNGGIVFRLGLSHGRSDFRFGMALARSVAVFYEIGVQIRLFKIAAYCPQYTTDSHLLSDVRHFVNAIYIGVEHIKSRDTAEFQHRITELGAFNVKHLIWYEIKAVIFFDPAYKHDPLGGGKRYALWLRRGRYGRHGASR